jgi:hypothetical protein
MGASMTGFIEYDHQAAHAVACGETAPSTHEPFSGGWTEAFTFYLDKDYALFCVLAGVRCEGETGAEHLIPRRPLPPQLSREAQRYVEESAVECEGWITAEEAERVLREAKSRPFRLSFTAEFALDATVRLAAVLGPQYVRLVFNIESP